MLGLNEGNRYYLYQQNVDMRNGINGLCKLVKQNMKLSPLSGDIFIFVSKNRENIKILRWDNDGFVLYHKRLEKGTFEVPKFNADSKTYTLPWQTFNLIMQGISLKSVKFRTRFRV